MPKRGPLPCVGGPLDGHTATPAPGQYSWIGGRQLPVAGELRPLLGQRPMCLVGGTGCSEPRDGRALYRKDAGVLVYAGHRSYLCCECGGYHQKCEGGSERRPCALGGSSDA